MSARRALLIAGNGFIGARVASRLGDNGVDVVVYHAGARPAPAGSHIRSVIAPTRTSPIVEFPEALSAGEADVAIHFLCMGREDARAFVAAFDGKARRLVLISSCDVYRAYGRFIGTEPGPPDKAPLPENAPLREKRYPYRAKAADQRALEYWYDKRDAEEALAAARRSETVVLRLPKVYGPGGNEMLATVYGFAGHPGWRWTHGHVDNVVAAIALAAFHKKAAGAVFNLGETETPTMGERLARLPPRAAPEVPPGDLDFRQDLAFDTSKIRSALGYADVIDEAQAMGELAERFAS